MPLRKGIKKVLVIGSGPIIIGQAAEFDYAGTQACRSLREEGLEVVLINSNPATIMTDANMADRIYIEPLTTEYVTKVIKQEKPDGLLPTLGGQVGLNLALQLAESGVLAAHGVRLLGTPLDAIKKAEDRELFKEMLQEIGEPVPESVIVSSLKEAEDFANKIGLPLIVRPAYTLGGTGGGIAHTMEELRSITTIGLKYSIINQALIERCVVGWKELEYEVMRDSANNSLTLCSIENIDPMGIHTGDSIVVAPSQTLSDVEHQLLRTASLKIISALGIEGGCNVQFALDPKSYEYFVIEVNPRVSRSSALASKATGYPIAKVAAKIAMGLTLDEIKNPIVGTTYACFEPALDYVVIKYPRWPFDKFTLADRKLGTQMKATGEVMSLDRTFEGALLKAVRSLEIGLDHLILPGAEELSNAELEAKLFSAEDERLSLVAEALRRGQSTEWVHQVTQIDCFFLNKINNILQLEKEIAAATAAGVGAIPLTLLAKAKKFGFSDDYLAKLTGQTSAEVRTLRLSNGIRPTFKMVDTCAGEYEAEAPYYYSSYDQVDEAYTSGTKPKVLVLGSGPIRIGQGIEFDYCSVHSVWALKEAGYETIIVNNNPETVSTDFDTADRLYFEPLTPENIFNIIDIEKPEGVIVQFGGQTAINLAKPLENAGVRILGTSVEDIDRAEDRERFDSLLIQLGIPKPPGRTAFSVDEAVVIAAEIGFPVLVRPSYVLGGRAMEIVYNNEELLNYMATAVKITPEHPVLVDKYLIGTELEVDAIADGTDVLIPGIMEHIERAGVHSGDSTAVYPPQHLAPELRELMIDYTIKLAKALNVKGLINVQYVLHEKGIYVLEVNPRSSRTVPYMSKITGIPMINLATKIIMGRTLKEMGYGSGLYPESKIIGVKAPVFSFAKLLRVDISLGPEMKSTGEVMGVDTDYKTALYKSMVAAGWMFPKEGAVLASIADRDKEEALPLIRSLTNLGYRILATAGTAAMLRQAGLPVEQVQKVHEGSPNVIDSIRNNQVNLVISTLTKGKAPERDGFQIRRAAVEHGIPCLTSLDTTRALIDVIFSEKDQTHPPLIPLQEYLT